MNRQVVFAKLDQIEEQARLTLDAFPKHLTKERLRLIIALVRFTKAELSHEDAVAGQRSGAAS